VLRTVALRFSTFKDIRTVQLKSCVL
jgi:hypothetical protein